MTGEPDVLSDDLVGRRVILGGVQRAIGFVAANLLTVAGAVIILRYLGVEEFGRYGTVMALIGVVQGISDAGLTAVGQRELALCRTDDQRREILANLLALRIALTATGIVVAVAFALLAGYDSALVVGTVVAGAGIFLASVQSAMLLPLGVELRNGAIAISEVLRQFVLVAGFGALVVAGAGLVPFFGVQILVGAVALAVTPLLLSRRHFVRPRWDVERMRALARIALPVAIATVLGVLYLRLLVVLMSLLPVSEREVGYYVTSTRVLELVGGLPFLMIAVVLPVLSVAARDDHERLVYVTARFTEVMAIGGVLVALVTFSLAGTVIELLGGAEYEPAVTALRIQCFAAVTIFIAAAWQPALYGMARIRALATALAGGIVVLLGTGLILIPSYDAEGAAIAAVAGDLALCVGVYIALHRSGPGPWVSVSALGRIALATALAAGAGLIAGLPEIPQAVLVSLVFGAAVLMLRAVPSELLDAARAARARAFSRGAG